MDKLESSSKILSDIITFLNSNNINYFFNRNFEQYPEVIGGDIDIICDLKTLWKYKEEILKIFSLNNWEIFKISDRPWVLNIQSVNLNIDEDRRFLVVEFFNSFMWFSFEYVNFSVCLNNIHKYKFFNVLDSDIGYFLTFIHYFLNNGFLPDKYYNKTVESLKSKTVSVECREVFSLLSQEKLVNLLEYSTKIRRTNIPEEIHVFPKSLMWKFRFALLINKLKKHPFLFAKKILNILIIIGSDFTNLSGAVIYTDCKKEDAVKILFLIKKYHLYKNKYSRIYKSSLILNNKFLSLPFYYYRLFRGGVTIIYNINNIKKPKSFFSKHSKIISLGNECNINDEILLRIVK